MRIIYLTLFIWHCKAALDPGLVENSGEKCVQIHQVDYKNPAMLIEYYQDPLEHIKINEFMACVMRELKILVNGIIIQQYYLEMSQQNNKELNKMILRACGNVKGKTDAETVGMFMKCTYEENSKLLEEAKLLLHQHEIE